MNTVKRKLKDGEPVVGLLVSTGHPDLAEMFALCGFDYLIFDTEHGNIGRETLQNMIRALDIADCTPIVRVACNDPVLAKSVLDMGALGIMFPHINSKEEATRAVRSCRYPPSGVRGCGPRKAANYGLNIKEYLQVVNEEIVIWIQIETADAVDRIDEILSVEGIDIVSIGFWDLSASMGYLKTLPEIHTSVKEAAKKVEAAARKAGILFKVNATNAEEANKLIERGYKVIMLGGDQSLFTSYRKELAKIKPRRGKT